MTRAERWTVWLSVAAVVVTGVGYGVLRYLLAATDEWGITAHPLEPLALKLHVLSGPLLVFALGLIATRHILAHLREGAREGRRSGVSAVACVLPMIASGYALQVVTHERWLLALAWVHGVTGTLFAVGAVVHFVVLHRRRRAGAAAPTSDATRPRPAAGAIASPDRAPARRYERTGTPAPDVASHP